MNNKSRLEAVLEGIHQDAIENLDFELDFNELRMCNEGKLYSVNKEGKEGSFLTDFATTQLFTKTDMPVRYMKRLLKESPNMVAEQFNYWAKKQEVDKKILIRGQRSEESGFVVRGVLSDKYTILDNKDVIESLIEVSDNVPDFKIESVYNNDKKLHMRLSFPDLYEDFGTSAEGLQDIIRVGLDIQNSEVGYSSLVIAPITYRLVCENGLKLWKQEEGAFRQRHVHIEREELLIMMQSSMGVAVEKGKELIEGMRESRKIIVDNPYEYIDRLVKKHKLPNKLNEKIRATFDIEPEHNMFGIVNGITRAARDLENHDSRIKLESLASTLMVV